MSSQSSEGSGAVKYFNGDSEDSKEYKRWKTWVSNKLLTLDKLPAESRGAYIYTLLSGKALEAALEAVEHLEPSTYQVKDGDKVLWKLLDERFPQKEKVDELGEILGEVFQLKAREGETMKMWAARSQELFERCKRKTGVDFPDQARGWLMLHRAGLSEEQKAVVIARATGDLTRESISAALRSCYPDFVAKKKGVASVEEVFPVEDIEQPGDSLAEDFQDVHEFLDDHQLVDDAGEEFPEGDVAEVLAASWREKRQELGRLQRNRQFAKAKEVKRSFRVEVEELKARTTCHRCGKRGHWAKECSQPKGASKGSKSTGQSAVNTSGAAMVETADEQVPDFVATVSSLDSLISKLRDRMMDRKSNSLQSAVALVSSPGFGVLDSGCGRTIVGASTLLEFEKIWNQCGIPSPAKIQEQHQFKYGNGEIETSEMVVPMPVTLAGRQGTIRASIVKGHAPLLISRTALKKLGASLDFQRDELRLFGKCVPLQVNQAGQYVVNLVNKSAASEVETFAEVMTIHPTLSEKLDAVGEEAQDSEFHVWVQEDSGVSCTPWLSLEGPHWNRVFRRIVKVADTGKILSDHQFASGVLQKHTIYPVASPDQHVVSEFFYRGPVVQQSSARSAVIMPIWRPSRHQARQLLQQVHSCHEVLAAEAAGRKGKVRLMEVFSPPRFAPIVQAQGHEARSYDLKTGFDLSKAADRTRVEQDLIENAPELLILCFVHAVLDTVPAFQQHPVLSIQEDSVPPACWDEVCAVAQTPKEQLLPVLRKLHRNLGHPPNTDLIRILQHAQASSEAIELARSFECDFCKSQAKPTIPLPAQPNRIHEFNAQVGLDVKNLRGWKPNQKIKALNMVDTASSFQRMVPFFQSETSAVLQQLFSEHWIAWAGPPKELVLDPAQTNMGDPMVRPCEMQGIHIRPIAAGAHWQLGKTESHGGWFSHVLDRLIEEHQPANRDEWLSCVHHAHIKNQMIQVHGFSPHQFVFGKGANVPDDLLGEPVSIVPATASLTDAALAKSQAMRVTARTALAKLQDDRALRVALSARPRRSFDFKPGSVVAYWRDQKWVHGQLQLGGRWFGPAVVIGSVGRNVIVIHRRQLLRCAPEQLRPSTTEEQQLLNTPNAELLGIKSMIEQGSLQSKNYIDLVPQSYPPMADGNAAELGAQMQQEDTPVSPPAPDESPSTGEDKPSDESDMALQPPETEPDMSMPEAVVSQPVDESPSPDTVPSEDQPAETAESSASSTYGPIRRRVNGSVT
eukprot:s3154_g5.t1